MVFKTLERVFHPPVVTGKPTLDDFVVWHVNGAGFDIPL
jgi:hypothetical protein